MRELFRNDCLQYLTELGACLEMAEACYSSAWESGHAHGYNEIACHVEKMTQIVAAAVNYEKCLKDQVAYLLSMR